VISSSPAQNALQLTNLSTWLWINPRNGCRSRKRPRCRGRA
jgi:hypothetical protein